MNTNPDSLTRFGNDRSSKIVPLTPADITYLKARKTQINSGIKTAVVCVVLLIGYRLIFVNSNLALGIGFGIVAVAGLALFWYFFINRVDQALAQGTKHVGQARIARKITSALDTNGQTSKSLILDWDFNKEIARLDVSKEMYDQVHEDERVYIEVASASKIVLRIE